MQVPDDLRYAKSHEWLRADGTVDPTFVSPEIDNTVSVLAVQPDGRLVIGGAFLQVDGLSRPRLARLEADGPLDPSYRHLEVVDTLQQAVWGQGFAPPLFCEEVEVVGQRLVEADLTARLGVGRSTVREALKILASHGVVEIIPHRGAVVRGLTAEDARNLLAVLEEIGRAHV